MPRMGSGRYLGSSGRSPVAPSTFTSKSGVDSTRTKPLKSPACGGVTVKLATGDFHVFMSRSAMMVTVSCASGLSPFLGRRISVRGPPGSWRMPQSCSPSPVTSLSSPSPARVSVSSFGSPWRMSSVASMVVRIFSRETRVHWRTLVEKMIFCSLVGAPKVPSIVSLALPSATPPWMARSLTSAVCAKAQSGARMSARMCFIGVSWWKCEKRGKCARGSACALAGCVCVALDAAVERGDACLSRRMEICPRLRLAMFRRGRRNQPAGAQVLPRGSLSCMVCSSA